MAVNVKNYNRQFLEKVKSAEPIFNNAQTKYEVEIRPLSQISVPIEATQYWRVVGVHHLTGEENRGNHHVYCDVLDEDGLRINGSRLSLTQSGASPVSAVLDKPAHEPGTNFPIFKSDRAIVAVTWPADNPLPSEEVNGLRIDHADEEVGNTWGHHSFYIVFQRTSIKATTIPNPLDPRPIDGSIEVETPPLTLEETIALVGQPKIIPLNPDAMFYKVAQAQNLGERLSSEYDAEHQGKTYRAQIYEKGIVYAEVGDWGNVKIVPRTN